jgi:dinuclear metal center YbgI/SA1388 family protein
MATVSDVTQWLQRGSPPRLAEEWDNVGLLVGDPAAECRRVLTCLTLTPDVAAEAVETGCQLVVTHHPLPFKPVKRIVSTDTTGRTLLALIRAGVAVFSGHTAYDSAAGGANDQLAAELGLTNVTPLQPAQSVAVCKLVCFVPTVHLPAVQTAVWNAGAGVIGEYSLCSFNIEGTGTFFPSDKANPAIGTPGRHERVAEVRFEVDVPKSRLGDVVTALRSSHPYEEPAYDIYDLASEPEEIGSGRIGRLPAPLSLPVFCERVKAAVSVATLQVTGDPAAEIESVAVACGSGGEFLADAIRRQADALVTGEARFHTALEARDAGVSLVLTGHYASERPAMEILAVRLAAAFPGMTVSPSQVESDPLRFL